MTTPPSSSSEQQAPWFASTVVYQIYPRSFADSDGDGIGDLPGITAKLDHLADLGVGVVWLSPVYASPQDDNGYDISDYRAIDPSFGTLADMDALIAAAHQRGIKVVMDLVVNHTSDEHAWFTESRASQDSPKRDWYVWRPPREGFAAGDPGAEPTNWRSAFSGSTWELDETTGEYYLHLFSRKQPDLNWENPEVRAAVADMMRWWLDRGVDGFRMDVINFISKRYAPDGSLPDGAPWPGGGPWGDGGPFFMTGPRLHEFLAELHREVFGGREGDFLTVGEMPGVTVADAVELTDGASSGGTGVVDMVFQFEHVDLDHGPGGKWDPQPFDLLALKASFGRWQAGLAERGWNSLYWDNHDQPRIVSRWGDDGRWWRESATALATLLHLHRGTPYVYQGEEIGMTNLPFTSPEDYSDIEAVNHLREAAERGADEAEVARMVASMAKLNRDNARSGMQWDGGLHGGFTAGTPWYRVHENASWLNVEAQRDDPTSVLAHYRALIALRKAEPCVATGGFTMLAATHPHVYAFTRATPSTELLVVVAVSGEEQPLDAVAADLGDAAAAWDTAELVLGNWIDQDDDGERAALSGPRSGLAPLRPWEARVLRRRATA
ncbi:oligo-1,6-glucosidase [Quadrisphaera granulorum]|uniref:Oligo-1,6-glucosidase n=1 Tax=Quadrisphaera granulorum TaxID=317664 RepID=A0A316ACM6_9ACTN|nr:alpha-glucosidase [Quadrisphaera granulorum]PWJ55505.1 oligo-1,6-glucosidase [Quadrisphaera granulorum]SZE95569.1 oligo-1,6-glucosidase [Quadrisphaera granulorum]